MELWSGQEFGFENTFTRDNKKKNNHFACETSTWPDLCPYPMFSKYLKQYGSNDLHKISASGDIST